MLFPLASLALSSCLFASAANISVNVGTGSGGEGLNFDPSTVVAAVNDNVVFTFKGAHAVTQGTFDSPCVRSGFDSEVKQPGQIYVVKVSDMNPVWIHCDRPGHCPAGMVFAINPPTSGNETYEAYKARAIGGSITTTNSLTTTVSLNTTSTRSLNVTSTTLTRTGTGASSPTTPPHTSSTTHSTTTSTTSKGGADRLYPVGLISILAAFATAFAIGLSAPMVSIFN